MFTFRVFFLTKLGKFLPYGFIKQNYHCLLLKLLRTLSSIYRIRFARVYKTLVMDNQS